MKAYPCLSVEKLEMLTRSNPEPDLAAIRASVPLLRFHRELDSALEQHFQAYGLSRGRWYILVQLYKNEGGLTPAELADQTGVSRAAVTGLVDGLVESGHVSRGEVGDDRRTYRVHLTPRGTDLIVSLLPDHLRRMQVLMQALSSSERQQFLGLLEKVHARIPAFHHES